MKSKVDSKKYRGYSKISAMRYIPTKRRLHGKKNFKTKIT
jgi:hypothetical protein